MRIPCPCLAVGLAFGLALGGASVARADDVIYHVRAPEGCGALPNCYETLVELVYDLASAPPPAGSNLLVDVGPGTFDLPFPFNQKRITVRGSGPGTTTIRVVSNLAFYTQSDAVRVEDLRFEGSVVWQGNGSSRWTNVDIRGGRYGFRQVCSGTTAVHEFFATTVSTSSSDSGSNAAFSLSCGKTSIHSSEIRAEGNGASGGAVTTVTGIEVSGGADVLAVGSAVRIPVPPPFGVPFDEAIGSGLYGARVLGNGRLRLHGGVVNVDASSTSGAEATGVSVESATAGAELLDAGFVLRTAGGGQTTRVTGPNIASSFLWQPGTTVPVVALVSQTGADSFVETDCDCLGDCDAAETADPDPPTETHLMVYREACADGWFDTTTRRCRNDLLAQCP